MTDLHNSGIGEFLALNKAFPFTIAWGGEEGVSKESAESISFYVD